MTPGKVKSWAQRTDEQLEGTVSGGRFDYKSIEGQSVGECSTSSKLTEPCTKGGNFTYAHYTLIFFFNLEK